MRSRAARPGCGSSRFYAVGVVCKCSESFSCKDLWGVSVVGSNPTTPTSLSQQIQRSRVIRLAHPVSLDGIEGTRPEWADVAGE